MKTVQYSQVIGQTARLWLGDLNEVTYTDAQKLRLVDAVNNALQVGWEYSPEWPDLEMVQERPFRPYWSAGESYAIDDEVYETDADKYYIALTANSSARPSESPMSWQEIDELDKYLPWSMTGFWDMAICKGIYDQNPSAGDVVSYLFNSDYHGCWPLNCDLTTVWVRFRLNPPVLTLTEFDAAETYSVGDIRYFPATGDCYQALLDSDGDPVWVKCDFPYFLRMYVPYAAAAELYGNDLETAGAMRSLADRELERAYAVNVLQQGDQPETVQWEMNI